MKLPTSTRKLLFRVGVVLLALPLLLVALGVGLAEELPSPPSLTMSISLPDGSMAPLAEVLAMGDAQSEAGVKSLSEAVELEEKADGPGRFLRSTEDRDPYRLGRDLADKGETRQAIALLRSVSKSHPEYARAQRFVGWDLYTKELDEPFHFS